MLVAGMAAPQQYQKPGGNQQHAGQTNQQQVKKQQYPQQQSGQQQYSPGGQQQQYNQGAQQANSAGYNKQSGNNNNDQHQQMPMPYKFSYAVKDEPTANDYAHQAESDGKVVTGQYRVLLPDGRTQIVTYRADENGYVADVKYEGEAKPWVPLNNGNSNGSFGNNNGQSYGSNGSNGNNNGYPKL